MTDEPEVSVGVLEPIPFEALSVVDQADLLLLFLARRLVGAVTLEAAAGQHVLDAERWGAAARIARLEPPSADALAVRVALLADLDPMVGTEQVGRVRVDGGSGVTDLFVVLRPGSEGFGVEIRPIPAREARAALPDVFLSGSGVVVGPYRFLDELGRGGMGIVYRAEHQLLEKKVAIKVLYPWMAGDEGASARLISEARAACRARHPGIVDVTDVGYLPDGRAYLVMELIASETLAQVLDRGPLPPEQAVGIAARVAEALAAAHGAGVVHRDVKPANIFVLPDGTVKIGDFGVAAVLRPDDDGSGKVAGTAWYMSPEQSQGRAADVRSDLYSLGCVLFEMVTGHVPYPGMHVQEVRVAHLDNPIPEVVGPHGPVAEPLQAVIRRALAKVPDDRYPNADAMARELRDVLRAMSTTDWRRWLPR